MHRAHRHRGFTLIELMIVVSIIMILATVAVGSYRRYIARARVTEVSAMFAEFRAKEESYRAEYGQYASVSTSDTNMWPCLDQHLEPLPKDWTGTPGHATNPVGGSCATTQPVGFTKVQGGLNINPFRPQLYCSYSLIAGAAVALGSVPANPPVTSSTMATALGSPSVPWWAAAAACDNDGFGANPGTAVPAPDLTTLYTAIFITTSINPTLIIKNEGR